MSNWWKQANFQKQASWSDVISALKRPGFFVPMGLAAALSVAYWFMDKGGNPQDFLQIADVAPTAQVAKEKLEEKVNRSIETVSPGELSFLEESQPSKKPSDNKNLSRGIRNNNPGNIDWNKNIKWQGTIPDDPTTSKNESYDRRFIRFQSPEYGLRAMARLLRTYQAKHKLATLSEIIKRWAPPSENDTRSYIKQVSLNSGIPANEEIDLKNDDILLKIMKAMIRHENGSNPYSDKQILKGIQLER